MEPPVADTLHDSISFLSPEITLNILWFLPYEDYVYLSRTSWSWFEFCSEDLVWKDLLKRDYMIPGFLGYETLHRELISSDESSRLTSSLKCSGHLAKTRRLTLSDSAATRSRLPADEPECWRKLYQTNYTWGSLKNLTWEKTSLDTGTSEDEPPPREGHDMALLGDFWILWGGFVNDPSTYVLDTTKELSFFCPSVLGVPPSFRYGHSMTALEKFSMILVFGGLSSGGYVGPLNDIYLLHLRNKEEAEKFSISNKEIPFELEWVKPDPPAGLPPTARGYHSACVSSDGNRVYFFGGIGGEFQGRRSCSCISDLACLDIPSWSWIDIKQTGKCPPRMAHSSFIINNELWIVGGGFGNDLVRSGHDLFDLQILDLGSSVWREQKLVPVKKQINEFLSLGRTHTSERIGNRILFFAGSRGWSNQLCVLDTQTYSVFSPEVVGFPPKKRHSPKSCFKDGKIWVWGGFSDSRTNLGDLWYLHLNDKPEAKNEEEQVAEGGEDYYAQGGVQCAYQ